MSIKTPEAERYGRYQLLQKLASGGMGEVYLAKSIGAAGFQKQVVIKKILPHLVENPQTVQSLVREAKLLVLLNHPNIVQVIDLGAEDDNYFMAMEYVHGYTLSTILHYCSKNSLVIPATACAFISLEVLSALAYAHNLTSSEGQRQNIIHRDVSPQNVMITPNGQVKLTDFGIAKVLSEAEDKLTQNLKGKWRYMAPEAVNGGRIDQRYDLFAVGILLFESLCRRNLFVGKQDFDILEKVRQAKVPQITRYHPEAPPRLVAVTEQALRKDPEQRYQSAHEFAEQLRQAILPTTERQAGEALQQFVSALYQKDDFPLNKPKITEFSGAGAGQTQSLFLRSRILSSHSPTKRARTTAFFLLATLLLIISSVVAYLTYRIQQTPNSSSEKPPVIIVSERPPEKTGTADLAATTPTADAHPRGPAAPDATSALPDPNPKPDAKIGKKAPAARPKPFTSQIGARIFRRHQPAIINCFKRFSAPNEGEVLLNVATTILSNGTVQQVTIKPEPMNTSQLGRCIIQVAKRIRYPRHDKPDVVFLLPIRLKKDTI